MNYDYFTLWNLRKQFKILSKLIYKERFENGELINKYLEVKRDIVFLKKKLRDGEINAKQISNA